MKILHLASFSGNLGDVYSNAGVAEYFDARDITDIHQIEIRRIYQNYQASDKISFNDVLNLLIEESFDCLLVGGGGFMDPWVPGTSTGTTFEVDYDLMDKVHKPMIFSSLGSFPHNVVPDENHDKFTRFLNYLSGNDYVSLMFRNDGSMTSIKQQYPKLDCSKFAVAGDHAFLYTAGVVSLATNRRRYICVNVGTDQLNLRSAFRTGTVQKEEYLQNFAKTLVQLCDNHDCEVLFIPHLYSDIEAAGLICKYLPDGFLRNRFSVVEYDPLGRNLDYIIASYRGSVFNICSRLHSNIMSICSNNLTFSLTILDRISTLAEQFDNAIPLSDINQSLSIDIGNFMREKTIPTTNDETREKIVNFLDMSFGNSPSK